jgi:hypothetical protein
VFGVFGAATIGTREGVEGFAVAASWEDAGMAEEASDPPSSGAVNPGTAGVSAGSLFTAFAARWCESWLPDETPRCIAALGEVEELIVGVFVSSFDAAVTERGASGFRFFDLDATDVGDCAAGCLAPF